MGDAGTSQGGVPIAVVGLSCRFPGDATDPSRLWDLLSEGKSAWSPIPKDKFNVDAFFHPNPDRNGSINVRGGHFLKEDIGRFDCSFFNISPNEAKAIDPQQRLQLESAYEALENAGIPMDKVAGSDTSVYVGVFNRDYSEMLARDPETAPVYQATGNGQAILSNRISYFFDLKGPSMTLDTACSASLSALHLACQSLRTGESKMALVGGTNMILSPDIMISMSLLRFLSEDGRSYTYDHRASGYARGEGVATVVLKPLDDAIRDGDPIRAVIRETAVNQDGRTSGITLPSRTAQEALIRTAYGNAGLDPAETGYFEAHGTGTAAGDPLEAGAISTVLGSAKKSDDPIIVGSIKTNVGHLEGASGLAGLIKTVLILEKGMIPPNLNFEKANEAIPLDEWNIKIPLELQPWPKSGPRRASVNSFGYGGTNAHVIIDDACHFLKQYRASKAGLLTNGSLTNGSLTNGNGTHTNGIHTNGTHTNGTYTNGTHTNGVHTNGTNGVNGSNGVNGADSASSAQNRVFLLSANDDPSGKAYAKLLASFVDSNKAGNADQQMQDLAFTLAERRSKLPYRLAVKAKTAEELKAALEGVDLLKFTRSAKPPRLGFVFTGQGAQWFAMGRELLPVYPVVRKALEKADALLTKLGSTWSLMEELLRDQETSRVDVPFVSQPLCTAVQLALVEMLASWGIEPSGVVGHSSGEIAAAYAAGALDFESAMKVAYYRGIVSALVPERCGAEGAMLAAGLGRDDAETHIAAVSSDAGKIGVACVNSPASVTISGDKKAVQALCDRLKAEGTFARMLKVGVAYHSHHMQAVAEEYLGLLDGLKARPAKPGVQFFSSVHGRHLADTMELDASYWVRNMVSPVLFSDAAAAMCEGAVQGKTRERRRAGNAGMDMLVEVGPHAAMGGPLKQILVEQQQKQKQQPAILPYGSVLVRSKDAAETALDLVSALVSKGYDVKLDAVNFAQGRPSTVKVTRDLPPYAWNHGTIHWAESRLSTGYRFRSFPRHDLVGAPVSDFNPAEPRWRNFIRLAENPWVRDHQVTRSILYPAAGMMVMAIEAMRQMLVIGDLQTPVEGYELRDVNIGKALVVPEAAEGVETILAMRPLTSSARSSSDTWHEFRIFSISKVEGWVEHSRGRISYRFRQSPTAVDGGREAKDYSADMTKAHKAARDECVNTIDPESMYESLDAIGLSYGETFRNITKIASGPGKSFSTIKIANTRDVMPYKYEQPCLIHPATLDCALQTMFPALSPAGKIIETPMVPTFVRSMFVSTDISSESGVEYEAWSEARYEGFKSTSSNVTVVDGDSASGVRPLIEIRGMECANLVDQGTPLDPDAQNRTPKICFTMDWDVDADLMTPADLAQLSTVRPTSDQEHKQIVTLDEVAFYFIDAALKQLSADDVKALTDYRRLFHNWMVEKVAEVRKGTATNFSPHWLTATEADKKAAMDWITEACIEGRVVCRMGANLVRVLKQEVEPLELMVEDDLLYDMYRYSMGIDRCYEHMAAFMGKLAHKNPTMRILEIGAGTGGATLPILETLGGSKGQYPRFSSYDFTDISTGFFEKARENFKEWGSLMQFKKFDVEQPPADQGFAEGTYDVIVAANVLHATKHMRVTMDHVRRLLKPGGKLVLMEIAERTMRMTFTLGNLPGWWLGADEGRTEGPSLSVDEWDVVLRDTGFSSPQMSSPDYLDVGDRIYSAITATAEDTSPRKLPQILVVPPQSSSDATAASVDGVIQNLDKISGDAEVRRVPLAELEDANVTGSLIVSLLELESAQLENVSVPEFDAIRQAIGSAKGVFWIARGGTVEGRVPEANLITGLSRTVRGENQALKFVTLDLDADRKSATSPSSIDVDVITRVFQQGFRDIDQTEGVDFEYSERNGQVLIPRIIDDSTTNEFIARDIGAPHVEKAPFVQPDRALKLEIGVPGLLDSLRFVDDPVYMEEQPLGADEVDIDIRATGVNFKDVMVSMGQLVEEFLGHEVSGIIKRVGSKVTDLKVGDRVCAWTMGGYGNFIRNPASFTSKLPDDMSFERAASLPIVYCTAYHALFDIARLQKGEKVLIHAAAGGVGQAAIQLCQYAGAEVFVTVGTEDKRQLVMEQYGIPEDHIFSSRDTTFAPGLMRITGGYGMDVILNSLSGEALLASWDCIARFGRFVEIGKRDISINSKLNMANFERNATFASFDLTGIIRHNKPLGARMLSSVMELVRSGAVKEVYPLTVFDTPDTEKAYRLMQAGKHVGKLVIAADQACEVPVLTTSTNANPLKLSGDASYLLVGGLGGLGRSLSGWLAEHGARHIVFLSRSGTDKPAARECIDELVKAGVHTAVYKCDVGDLASLNSAMKTCRAEFPPVRGVIHAGMVLRDGIFGNMTHDDWKRALHPKLSGTRNLCTAFAGTKLDFFTIFSSSAGVVGSFGQGNYAAASAFQDAVSYGSSKFAAESGLPITTIDLGMILGVGYVAENAHVEANLRKWGFVGIEPDQFFSIIKSSIMEPHRGRPRSQLMTGVGTRGMVYGQTAEGDDDDMPFWLHDVKFSHLLQLDKKLVGATDTDSAVNLPSALRSAQSMADAQQIVCDALLDKMSKILVIPAEDLNGQLPMAAYGVDSLVAVELRNWIFRETKVDVPMFEMLGDNSLLGLSEGIAKKSSLVDEKLRAE